MSDRKRKERPESKVKRPFFRNELELIVFILVISALLCLLYIAFIILGTEAAECTLNPLVFGAERLDKSNRYPIICECHLISPNPSETMYFDNTSIWFGDPIFPELNESEILRINITLVEDSITDYVNPEENLY